MTTSKIPIWATADSMAAINTLNLVDSIMSFLDKVSSAFSTIHENRYADNKIDAPFVLAFHMGTEAVQAREFVGDWWTYQRESGVLGAVEIQGEETADSHPVPKAKRIELIKVASRHMRTLLLSIGEEDETSEYVGHTLTKLEEELNQIDYMLGVGREEEVTA